MTTNTELMEFKSLVAIEARELARQHNLCAVVDEALAKMGIETDEKDIEVTFQVTKAVRVTVDKFVFESLPEDQREQWIKDRIAFGGSGTLVVQPSKASGAGLTIRNSGGIRLTNNDVNVIGIDTDLPEPEGAWWMSTNGRVLHYIEPRVVSTAQENTNAHVLSYCGRLSNYAFSWVQNPNVRDYNRCGSCVQKLEANA